MTRVLAIDQGTSGTKAIVVDHDGQVHGHAERPVRPSYLGGGGVEQDPDALLASVIDSGREAIARSGLEVDVVTLANQGETVLAWDPDTGRPLSNLVVWQDRRAEAICTELEGHRDLIQQRTGLVLDPYFSAPKQTWVRRNITRAGVVTTSDTWLIHQLTGAFVTDAATASRSLVTDLDTGRWDPELLGLFGLAEERLPEIVACDELVGTTEAFGRTAQVGGLIVDQQAALLGEGCLRPGEAKCTFGTGAFLLVNTGAMPTRSSAGLAASIAWQARGETTYCLDGQVYTAASAVRWMEQLGYISSAADLDVVAAEDNGGVIAVPALAGLGAPWWRPEAKASIHGMSLSTTAGHLVVAVLEGIAAQVAELGSLVAQDLGTPLTQLRVDGGLTQSRTLMQAVANLMQIEIQVYPNPHATALGAAACARLAMDPALTLAEAVVSWTPKVTYTPRWTADQASEFRSRWTAAAAADL
ncbi:MAG TPA: FGGY family carbohydrate kinase [Propionibacteriaceae bacterium]